MSEPDSRSTSRMAFIYKATSLSAHVTTSSRSSRCLTNSRIVAMSCSKILRTFASVDLYDRPGDLVLPRRRRRDGGAADRHLRRIGRNALVPRAELRFRTAGHTGLGARHA